MVLVWFRYGSRMVHATIFSVGLDVPVPVR